MEIDDRVKKVYPPLKNKKNIERLTVFINEVVEHVGANNVRNGIDLILDIDVNGRNTICLDEEHSLALLEHYDISSYKELVGKKAYVYSADKESCLIKAVPYIRTRN